MTNLRGVIVPIVDLRLRLGLQPTYDTGTVTGQGGKARMLILVDIEQLMSGAEMGLVAGTVH